MLRLPNVGERGNYDICQICQWEDDGQDDAEFSSRSALHHQPDDVSRIAGGPNADYSLTEARLNFSQFHQMYRPADTRAFGQTNQDRELHEALIAVFDTLLPDVSATSCIAALPEIQAASERVNQALRERLDARKFPRSENGAT
jgi:hypothetical protein